MIYGNEKEIGDAISSKIEEGVVERNDLYITSKVIMKRIFEYIDIISKYLTIFVQ